MSKQNNRISRAKKLAHQFRNKIQKPLNFALRGKLIKHNYSHLFINDMADLVKYCNYITSGKLYQAYNMQNQYFDTDVYESIPEQLYNLIIDIVSPEEEE